MWVVKTGALAGVSRPLGWACVACAVATTLAVTLAATATSVQPWRLPVTSTDGWQALSFRRIPPNRLRAGPDGLEIVVDRSAGPVVYALARPARLARVEAEGRIVGSLRLPSPGRQGENGFDDYALRVGLVETGKRTLGAVQRRFVPEWVRRLHDLAPPGAGISRIRFFNLGADPGRIGSSRRHPLSDLLFEEVVATPDASNAFRLDVPLAPPAEVAAIWLSADGDDTGSRFVVRLTRLELTLAAD